MKNPTISQTYGLLARVLARLAGLNLVFLALMTVFRGVFFLVYGSGGGAAGMGWYVPAAFWMGLRFDLSVLCYLLALVLPLLLALPLAAPRLDGRRVTAWGAAGARWYTVITFCLVSGVLAADIGYYSYFQDHINILVFGVYEDDTWALARTVAKNYNLFVIFPLAATYCWGIHRISRRFLGGDGFRNRVFRLLPGSSPARGWISPFPAWMKNLWPVFRPARRLGPTIGFLGVTLGVALGARGTLGLHPLNQMDTGISPSLFLNKVGYNGVFALMRAIELRVDAQRQAGDDLTARMGYGGDPRRAVVDFLGRQPGAIGTDPLAALWRRTPVNKGLADHPPHVVVLMMESMGSHFMDYNSPRFDVLGELAPHFKAGLVFDRFVSAENGTIGSLTALVTAQPMRPGAPQLSESGYMQTPLDSGGGFAFRRKGYQTTFVYGGTPSWREIDKYFIRQGFDHVEGEAEILAAVNTLGRKTHHDWGVFDEFLLDYIFHKLSTATQPQFIVVMSTTNHPPYDLPEGYQPLPLEIPPALAKRIVGNPRLVALRLKAYQYANRQVGLFLTRLKSSPQGGHTLVAVTGDHNFGGVVDYTPAEALQWRGVPLYLAIPPGLRPPGLNRKNLTRTAGAHNDILPTLYHLALSDAPYLALGTNLLDDTLPHMGVNGAGVVLGQTGAVEMEAAGPAFYHWGGGGKLLVPAPADEAGTRLLTRYRAGLAVTEFTLRETQKEVQPARPRDLEPTGDK